MPEKFKKYTHFMLIYSKTKFKLLAKEFFRKSIHMCSAFIPLFLKVNYLFTVVALIAALVVYIICEILRLKGINVPVISEVTEIASRKRDENRFVLGPVTLVLGILVSAIFFKSPASTVGIFALSFGDGLASLSGKCFGKIKVPLSQGKTVAGCITCFLAIFISSFLVLWFYSGTIVYHFSYCAISLILASVGMFIELLPIKDFDNLIIPFLISLICSLCLN